MIIVFILLTSMLLTYFFVIAIILKKNSNNSELIVIPPPYQAEKIETDTIKGTQFTSDSGDRYLNLIVNFLLEQAHEPFKIVKFIDSVDNNSDRSFILSQLKSHNLKLHDTVISLLGINTDNIEDFESENIDIQDDSEIPDDIRLPTPSEDILMGGIPYQLLQEQPLENIENFTEYWYKINKTYIARVLTEEQKRQIDRNAELLLNSPISKSTKITKSIIKESFVKGEQIAKDIAKEID